jgi:multiple sugar transport system ATP-binding protein
MPEIVLRDLTKRFGTTVAINGLSARIEDKEFFVVVGPTGCGKTTLLRLIAGLVQPDRGEVLFDGIKMNEVPPERRKVRMVFQGHDYALFPHLSIYSERRWSNLSFPLRIRGEAAAAIADRVGRVTRRLGISGELFPRRPRELSEGEKQRVAIGKATVLPTQVFLLDEPISNLDPPARAGSSRSERRDRSGSTRWTHSWPSFWQAIRNPSGRRSVNPTQFWQN